MGNERLSQATVLRWHEGLEGRAKIIGKKKKTVLYWKRMLRGGGECDGCVASGG